MPTIQQLVRKGRQDKTAVTKTAALKEQPAAPWCMHPCVHHHP